MRPRVISHPAPPRPTGILDLDPDAPLPDLGP
jgi:hypothetical protein